ncbi:hypothetical protein GCK72_022121 [Caenorhabditis remanei]|uniref:Uncharacterized protein n=1 Tax=Caenorhabditis remanei TaxID=31234 RepID=A0A6A5FSY4_CAERE|nr:hypothetical protein GCK72_022121 [Caenorhabditis remanei]KAF1745674.1 hypothetical protein GCK72_022121 [Caenorhabditis remanei]
MSTNHLDSEFAAKLEEQIQIINERKRLEDERMANAVNAATFSRAPGQIQMYPSHRFNEFYAWLPREIPTFFRRAEVIEYQAALHMFQNYAPRQQVYYALPSYSITDENIWKCFAAVKRNAPPVAATQGGSPPKPTPPVDHQFDHILKGILDLLEDDE